MAQIEFNREFQEEDVPFFLSHKKSLVLYEPRLGKTPVTCRVLALDPETKVILINCSKNALSVWFDHLASWWRYYHPNNSRPLYIRYVHGTKSEREAIYKKPIPEGGVIAFIGTYEAFNFDWEYVQSIKLDRRIDTIVLDEVHRKLRSRKTKSRDIYKALLSRPNVRRFHALSGTLAGKWGPADYWTLLNIIAPHEFTSYWQFANTFCVIIEGMWGKEIVGTRNMDAFHLTLSRFARTRIRAVVAPQMPKVQRGLVWVEPTAEQAKYYKQWGKTPFVMLPNGNFVVAENSLEKFIRKRQLLTCPKILDPSMGIGASMEHLVAQMEEARDDGDIYGTHIVIFTTFRKAIVHFEQYLHEHGFTNTGILVGGTEPEEVVRVTEQFRRTKGIIIGTTQFAQAFSLTPAQQCFHIGYDFDPNNNKQAEDRLVPQTGVDPISSWYYGVRGTEDDEMAERVTLKNQLIHFTTKDPRSHVYDPNASSFMNTSDPNDAS